MKKILIFSLLLTFIVSGFVMAADYNEPPFLEEQVQKGDLPPIEERVPEDPFIIGPDVLIAEEDIDWSAGQYGGTLNTAHGSPGWNPDIFIMANEGLLMAPGISAEGIRGNIVKDFEVNEDNTEFTFYMREGLKWSDGVPVTTEDVRFAVEDVMNNDQLTPIFPAKYRSGNQSDGEPMELEILDDYTFKISFNAPYGGFLKEIAIAGWTGYTALLKPAHYLKQFHTKYTPIEDMQEDLEEEELEDEWWDLFSARDVLNWDLTRPEAIGFPVLYPWIRVEGPSGVMSFERNPYYFKMDNEGNQLPYIDEVKSFEASDVEMVNMKVITGEIDYLREDTALSKMPLYKSNAEKSGYRAPVLEMHVDPTCLFINYTYEDPVWREVVRDLRFREAINMAIDRDEIIESIYYELASKPELIPNEYNQEQARQLLDEMGMDQRDSQGFRLSPGGEKFELIVETADYAPDIIPTAEMVTSYLQEVGINATLSQKSAELIGQRQPANQLTATFIWNVQPMWNDNTWTDYVPTNQWAPLWIAWYNTNGEEGEEPPAPVKRLFKIKEERNAYIPFSPEERELNEEMYQIHYDNIYIIPMVEKAGYPMIVNENLRNIPHSGQAIAANYSGEQFYYEE